MRVVSCVPSLSELAEDLAPACLVGRTRFCISPPSIKPVLKIGGTKDLDTETILRLQPDLVLAVKEENEKEQIEWLVSRGLRVHVFDIRNLEDAIAMVRQCGTLLGNPARAAEISGAMVPLLLPQPERGSILYFIWKKPWMCAGNDTFIGDLLRRSGFRNLAPQEGRYPALNSLEDIHNLKPDFIFLSSEPFPFRDKDLLFFENNFPASSVYKVDGGIFSWYGIQTPLLPSYLESLNLKRIGS